VEATGASMTPCIDGGHANEVEPRLEDTPNGATLIPGGGEGGHFGRCDIRSGSFDNVDLGAGVLGLPGYPRAPLLPTNWRQVAGAAELMCSWVATVRRLLKETLAIVG
jgi:hypothetical protein